MIYEYCLVVEGEINPYPADYEIVKSRTMPPRKPDVALLQINHLIRAESEVVLYGKNLWRLSRTGSDTPMWDASRTLIRKLITSFDVRDLDSTTLLFLNRFTRNFTDWDYGWEIVRDDCHSTSCQYLIDELWRSKISIISGMTPTDLTFDFKNCYCPNGCCRLVCQLECGLNDPWQNPLFRPRLEIIGLYVNEDAELITKMGFLCYD